MRNFVHIYYTSFLGLPQVILPSVHLPRTQGAPAFLKTFGAIFFTISSILSARDGGVTNFSISHFLNFLEFGK